MVDKELLSRKLSRLRSYIDVLKQSEDITWERYRSDLRAKAFVERYLHLAIEEVIDIANHLVSFNRWREPTGSSRGRGSHVSGQKDKMIMVLEDGRFQYRTG